MRDQQGGTGGGQGGQKQPDRSGERVGGQPDQGGQPQKGAGIGEGGQQRPDQGTTQQRPDQKTGGNQQGDQNR